MEVENNVLCPPVKYKRIVLKMSGEVLRNEKDGNPIDGITLRKICTEIKEVHSKGIQIGLVIGGGNIFRGIQGASEKGIDRTSADYMGMLATMINGMALMDCLEKLGVPVRVQTALPVKEIGEPFILRRALSHLEKGRLVIFVAGTGSPYFSTDTTAALRASEIRAQVILKATKVDGIYNKDPLKYPDAVKYKEISYWEALEKRLKVMDATAFSLCMDNNIPIVVFNFDAPGSILKAITGESIGTLVRAPLAGGSAETK